MTVRPMRLVGVLAGGALFGKLLGFARELEMARLIGAGALADSLRGALTAVLLPINPLQGELMTAGMIPLLREWREHERGPQLTASLVFSFLLLGLLLMAVVVLAAAPWVGLLLAGFGPDAQEMTVRLVRIMALAIPASILTAALSGVEVSAGQSRITVLRMSLQNLGVIVGIGVMAVTGRPEAIAWGFAIAFNLVAVLGCVSVARKELLMIRGVRPSVIREATDAFLRRAKSLLLLPFLEQGNLLLERMLASAAVVGTLASLEYARTLTECALFLVSQPIGYVLLTRRIDDHAMLRQQIRSIVMPLLALCVPASAFLACFPTEIVSLLFERGRFGEQAVSLTAGALIGISAGLWASTIGWILLRLLNAGGRNTAAAFVVGTAWCINALVNAVLAPHLGVLGLALGEAARGLALLVGTVLALGVFSLVLRQVALASVMAALLMMVAFAVKQAVGGTPVMRLLAGGVPFAVISLCWLYFTMPPEMRRRLGLDRLALRRRPRSHGPAAGPPPASTRPIIEGRFET
ncbi:Virulence factor mviN (plasmid) [Roseomonas mucosa]|nr:Virulence factor mviN [Roseomonas mucosa]